MKKLWEEAPEFIESEGKIVIQFHTLEGGFDTKSKLSVIHHFSEVIDYAKLSIAVFDAWIEGDLLETDDIFAYFVEGTVVLGCFYKGNYYVNENVIDH